MNVDRFEELVRSLREGDDRLAIFEGLPEELQQRFFESLGRECADYTERARLADPDEADWHRRARVGRLWRKPRSATVRRLVDARASRDPGARDPLIEVAPPVYVELLTGLDVPRHGMIRCPLPGHDDRWPSCRVYDEPERGFYCFGCHAGGSIYDFAAGLWGIGTRGEDFKALRRRLAAELLGRAAA